MADLDPNKDVYLFLHGNRDLEEKCIHLLVAKGFPKEKIKNALGWAFENKDKYALIIKDFLKLEPFITTLVNELQGDRKKLAFVQKCLLMNFIRSEADIC